eukprot:239086_1
MTRCIGDNTTDIRDCIGQWENYHDNTWHIDSNMKTISCDDVCITSSDYRFNDVLLEWQYFNSEFRSNVYYSDVDAVYLSVVPYWVNVNGGFTTYIWSIYSSTKEIDASFKKLDPYSVFDYIDFYCQSEQQQYIDVHNIKNYIFNIDDCIESQGTWYDSLMMETEKINMSISTCTSPRNYAVTTLLSSQVCTENSYNTLFDGVYKWLYYDSTVGGSIYYNLDKNMYVRPYIPSEQKYEYHIYG